MMSNTPKVSILVPIFNVEKYLSQCLASIVAQTYKNIEIICINDGSTDSSPEMITSFAEKDERIKVINKENGGYGQSMNMGLDAASGEYIGIVESDDYIDTDMFEVMINAAIENDAEIVKTDFLFTWTTPRFKEKYYHAVPKADANKNIKPYENYGVVQSQPAIWSGIYKKSFLEKWNLRFSETPGASFQDTAFCYNAWAAADRAFLIDRAFLHYRQDNVNSSIKATNKVYAVTEEIDKTFEFIENLSDDRREKLKLIMQGIVYKTYRWNIIRIDDTLKPDFLEYMREYFVKAEKASMLKPEYFESDFYAEVMLLINDPQIYVQRVNNPTTIWNVSTKLIHYIQRNGLRATVRRALNGK